MALRDTLKEADVDQVVVTGDLSYRGRDSELESFHRIFTPLQPRTQLTLVPGNRDRLGDDVAGRIQPGPRVSVVSGEGVHVVRFDSTGPYNRPGTTERGVLNDGDVDAISEAIAAAPSETLVVLTMHHHILPLLAEHAPERLLSWLDRSYAEDLARGQALLETLRGRCDLVLHGGGRTPQMMTPFADTTRPLSVYGAGHSNDLGRVRVFWHERGRVLGPPAWLRVGLGSTESQAAPPPSRWMPAAARALFAA